MRSAFVAYMIVQVSRV